MQIKGRKKSSGFTLVELMIVVAIIGILAAIAIPAFSRYVKKSRTVEASGHINKLWSGSVAYYEADHASSTGVLQAKQRRRHSLACALESDDGLLLAGTGEDESIAGLRTIKIVEQASGLCRKLGGIDTRPGRNRKGQQDAGPD